MGLEDTVFAETTSLADTLSGKKHLRGKLASFIYCFEDMTALEHKKDQSQTEFSAKPVVDCSPIKETLLNSKVGIY